MKISFYETKERIILTKYIKVKEEPYKINDRKIKIEDDTIDLYKEIIEIEKIIKYKHKTEIILLKKVKEFWRCITQRDTYSYRKYEFDLESNDKLDTLEKMMYYLYENGNNSVKRSMNQSFYESKGTVLSLNYNKNNK
ncbi:hypothetical protein H312_02499 [Anncaliia algerae PRA339]|uniref:SGS domain-containing protein n=1 Tax=Anncaliia algerae PRA339 TaxID=1288291 RepID=A0A059EYX6_9MICR|nr:hypothetical protein H312_02499 [Anncaliia algerae PRA339]